jgi:hypothetical protein
VIEAYLGTGLTKNKTPEQMRGGANTEADALYLTGENMTGGYGGADILRLHHRRREGRDRRDRRAERRRQIDGDEGHASAC